MRSRYALSHANAIIARENLMINILSGEIDPTTLFEIGYDKKQIKEACEEGFILFTIHKPIRPKTKETDGYIDSKPNERAAWYCHQIINNLDYYWEQSINNPNWEGVKSYYD